MATPAAAAAAWRPQPLTCTGHTRPVVDLAFSQVTPDGYFLISACKGAAAARAGGRAGASELTVGADGLPMLRNGQTGDWLGTFQGHSGAVWGVALDDGALRAATGSADFTACVRACVRARGPGAGGSWL